MNARVAETLKNRKFCICCGATENDKRLDRDHFFPKCLVKQPKDARPVRVFKQGVAAHANIFPVCREDHEVIDRDKTLAFGIGRLATDLDPVGLALFLRGYPITDDVRYHDLQIGCMIEVSGRYVAAVAGLNGELSPTLV